MGYTDSGNCLKQGDGQKGTLLLVTTLRGTITLNLFNYWPMLPDRIGQ
jgi:hypothetical protein